MNGRSARVGSKVQDRRTDVLLLAGVVRGIKIPGERNGISRLIPLLNKT